MLLKSERICCITQMVSFSFYNGNLWYFQQQQVLVLLQLQRQLTSCRSRVQELSRRSTSGQKTRNPRRSDASKQAAALFKAQLFSPELITQCCWTKSFIRFSTRVFLCFLLINLNCLYKCRDHCKLWNLYFVIKIKYYPWLTHLYILYMDKYLCAHKKNHQIL